MDGAIQEGLAGDIFGSATPKPKSTGVGRILDAELARLTPFEFEALSAILLAGRFEKVLLTPKSGDRGVDVIGVSAKEIALIQCKHRLTEADANAEDAIEELIDGQDYYRENLIPKKLKSLPIRLIIVLSGKADKSSQAEAKRAAIELLDHSVVVKLLSKAPITPVDLQEMERTRVQDLREIFS